MKDWMRRLDRREYILMLAHLYRESNLADSDRAQDWQTGDESATHCRLLFEMARSLGVSYEDWRALIDDGKMSFLYGR
mgnify:FL=1